MLDAGQALRHTCMMVQVRNRPGRARRPSTTPASAVRVRRRIDALLDPALFKALSDPTRLRLLATLSKCGRPCTVGELALCAGVDLSVVSRHLSALSAAGVLLSNKSGRSVAYQVRFESLARMFRALADALTDCCPGGCCGKGACGCGCQSTVPADACCVTPRNGGSIPERSSS